MPQSFGIPSGLPSYMPGAPIWSPNDPLSFGYSDRQASAFNERAYQEANDPNIPGSRAAQMAAWQQLQQPREQYIANNLISDYRPNPGLSTFQNGRFLTGQPAIDARDQRALRREKMANDRRLGRDPAGLQQDITSDDRFYRLPAEYQQKVYGEATGRSFEEDTRDQNFLNESGVYGPITRGEIPGLQREYSVTPEQRQAALYQMLRNQKLANELNPPEPSGLEVSSQLAKQFGANTPMEFSQNYDRQTGLYVMRDQDGFEVARIPVDPAIAEQIITGIEGNRPINQPVVSRTPEQESRLAQLLAKSREAVMPNPNQPSGPPPSLMNDVRGIGQGLGRIFRGNNMESLATDLGGTSFYNSVAGLLNYPNRLGGYITGQQPSQVLPYDPGQQDYGYNFR